MERGLTQHRGELGSTPRSWEEGQATRQVQAVMTTVGELPDGAGGPDVGLPHPPGFMDIHLIICWDWLSIGSLTSYNHLQPTMSIHPPVSCSARPWPMQRYGRPEGLGKLLCGRELSL